MRSAMLLLIALCVAGCSARCLKLNGADRLGRVPILASSTDSKAVTRDVDEASLKAFLRGEYEQKASKACNEANVAEWNYNVDNNNQTAVDEYNRATLALATFEKEQWQQHFQGINVSTIKDADLKRQLQYLVSLGTSALSSEDYTTLNDHLLTMQTAYSAAKICPYRQEGCDLEKDGLYLDPGMEDVITTSRDYDELLYVWKAWRDNSGKKMRTDYKEYVRLNNKAAVLNGFKDMGEMWQGSYEVDDFKNTINKLWDEMKPLYDELHTYTLNRLRKLYGDRIAKDATLIPAHILGDMWGQTWINIYDILVPYPDASSYDVTQALVDQKYTPRKMFETADAFYQSMGLLSNEMCYGPKALIERPSDGRAVTCHGSAWDFCDGKDFRIKMCTKVNQDDFRTIHHEMGHIQYYQQYKDLPYVLRTGANPGFHEAIGDTIALSVDTPKHLEKVNLLSNYNDTMQSRVNALMKQALEKVAFLPFGLLVDMWRWDVFSGVTPESEWNKHWWELREKYQMLTPPVARSEDDFDPGAKYHIPADSKYISYFVAHILEFQFYRSLCIAAGEYSPDDPNSAPLHTCDFYQNTAAGSKLGAGLKLGASQHWSQTLQTMTGETEMSAKSLLEYFQPLYEFLQKANKDDADSANSSGSRASYTATTAVLSFLIPSAMLLLCKAQ